MRHSLDTTGHTPGRGSQGSLNCLAWADIDLDYWHAPGNVSDVTMSPPNDVLSSSAPRLHPALQQVHSPAKLNIRSQYDTGLTFRLYFWGSESLEQRWLAR